MASLFPEFRLFISVRAILLAGLTLPIAATSADAALTISTSATKNVNCSAGVCSATKANAVLNASDLQNMLASSSMQVVSGSIASSINVKAALSWVSANTLTLDAYTSVVVDKPVAVAGPGGLTVTTNDGGTGGALSFGIAAYVTFWSTSDQLTIDGTSYTLVNDISTLRLNVGNNANGNYALAESYDASADGTYSQAPVNTFSGTFQGLGNTISNLTINSDRDTYVGLFGLTTEATIQYLHLKNVSVQVKHAHAGGLVGQLSGEIIGCSVSGIIKGGAETFVGGLVGYNEGTISNSWSTAKVNGSIAGYAGGLVGYNTDTISDSYATGNVSSTLSGAYVGGLVGKDDLALGQFPGAGVFNSYATGAVTGGTDSWVGGLEGYRSDPDGSDSTTLNASYSTGTATGGTGSTIGGLLGSQAFVASDNYWDTTTSGITNLSQGCGNSANCPGVTGQSTSQLQAGLPAGFSSAIWGESPSINGGLPYLLAIPPK